MSSSRGYVPKKYYDEEWHLWWHLHHHKKSFFNNLKCRKGNLFSAPNHFALAHGVSRDFRMSQGIAVHFKRRFGRIDQLLRQNQKSGGLASLFVEGTWPQLLHSKHWGIRLECQM
ncbi:ADP-ribose glycohydrolase OARD1-like [Leptinotarsa decemlineata]|uniref:ADP-ribose glycohydrolase OARD1-like n=1 Tax=Leptinotarsa decemlineata TaxID=7539 RepID=UPI003D3059EF